MRMKVVEAILSTLIIFSFTISVISIISELFIYMNVIDKIEKEKLKNLIKESYSLNEVLQRNNLCNNGKIFKLLNKFVIENNVDISHFNRSFNRIKHHEIIKNCPVCNKKFKTKKGSNKEQIVCSINCSNYYNGSKTENTRLKISKKLKHEPLQNFCKNCNNEFFSKNLKIVFCSHKCAAKINNLNENIILKIKKTKLESVKNGTHKGWKSRSKIEYLLIQINLKSLIPKLMKIVYH